MLPLSGYRIVEVEGLGPAPFAGMMLSDLGGDVIVVNRKTPTELVELSQRKITDRGKRSIALNLKSETDCKIFLALVRSADVLIEGFRPGVMEKLGLGPEECMMENPKLIYGRMTGWGQNGPLSKLAGHDLNYLSLSGVLSYAENSAGSISVPPTVLGDLGGGALYLVVGIVSALLAVSKGGKGTVIDASIVDGAANLQNLLLSLSHAPEGNPSGNPLSAAHWSRIYACSDGRFVSVQCVEPKFYRIFLEKLGLGEDREFSTHQFSAEAWPKLTEKLTGIFKSKPQKHWADLFADSDACVFPVLTPDESSKHPHSQHRRIWFKDDLGPQAAPAPKFGNAADWTPPPIPELGEHTDEILSELGIDDTGRNSET